MSSMPLAEHCVAPAPVTAPDASDRAAASGVATGVVTGVSSSLVALVSSAVGAGCPIQRVRSSSVGQSNAADAAAAARRAAALSAAPSAALALASAAAISACEIEPFSAGAVVGAAAQRGHRSRGRSIRKRATMMTRA